MIENSQIPNPGLAKHKPGKQKVNAISKIINSSKQA